MFHEKEDLGIWPEQADQRQEDRVPSRPEKREVKRRFIRGKSDEEILVIVEAEIADLVAEAKLIRKDIRAAKKMQAAEEERVKIEQVARLVRGHDLGAIEEALKKGGLMSQA